MDMYTPALPYLARDFSMPGDHAQYTITVWFIGALIFQILIGPISDRLGRRPILLLGVMLFAIGSFVCATTDQFSVLMFGRFLQGCTVAIPLVVGYAAVHESFDTPTAMKVIAIMGSITILAPTLGPLAGSLIIYYSNWRFVFWFLGLWALVSAIAMFFKMPETLQTKHPLHFQTVVKGYFKILKNSDFLRFSIPSSLAIASVIIWMIEGPFIIVGEYKHTVLTFGVMQLCIFTMYILGIQKLSSLVDEYNPVYILRAGFAISLLGVILLSIVGIWMPKNIYLITLCLMLFVGGISLCLGPSNRLSIDACENMPMGSRTAMFSTMMNVCAIGGTALITLINNKTLLNMSIAMLIGSLLAFLGSMFFQHPKKV